MRVMPIRAGLDEAKHHLVTGGVLIYPTESSYGIGCTAGDRVAVGNVFALKERPIDKLVLILVSSLDAAMAIMVWNPLLQKLADRYWPGPLTMVAQATEEGRVSASGVLAPDGTIAVRVSAHPVARELSRIAGPIVSSSANRTGCSPCFDVVHLREWLEHEDEELEEESDILILDAGKLPERPPSTVVRVTSEHFTVLRQGLLDVVL